MLSAKGWLAGIVPWWNPYARVGMPLAAEMQPVSFFLPFVPLPEYVGQSVLSSHRFSYGHIWLLPSGAPLAVFPFAYGPQFLNAPAGMNARAAYFLAGYLTQLRGWFGPAAMLLALTALACTLIGLFILFWQTRLSGLGYQGLRPAIFLADLIPGIAATDTMRFVWPAMELACFILAGIAIDHWQGNGRLGWRAGLLTLVFATVIAGFSFLPAWPSLNSLVPPGAGRLPFAVMATAGEVAVAALALFPQVARKRTDRRVQPRRDPRRGHRGFASLPQFAGPRTGQLDLGGVRYLEHHFGRGDAILARVYSLQPFGPNYPAAFRLAAIDDNALPVQRIWRNYIQARLDPYADVVMFTGSQARALHCVVLPDRQAALYASVFPRPKRVLVPPDQPAELRRHLAGYEATGVEYVIAPPNAEPFIARRGLPLDPAPARPLVLGAGQSVSLTVPPGLIGLRRISRMGA